MTKVEIIKDWIENKGNKEELIEIVRQVNGYSGALEDYNFYYMDELDELFDGVSHSDLLDRMASDFDIKAEGFKEGVYGLESANSEDVAQEIKAASEEVADEIVEIINDNSYDMYLPQSLEDALEEADKDE